MHVMTNIQGLGEHKHSSLVCVKEYSRLVSLECDSFARLCVTEFSA